MGQVASEALALAHFETVLPFTERTHLNRRAVTERSDIGKASIDPLRVDSQPDRRVNEHFNLVAASISLQLMAA